MTFLELVGATPWEVWLSLGTLAVLFIMWAAFQMWRM